MGIYSRPSKLKDALAILASSDARPVAGCTDVFAATEAQGLTGDVLDITNIAELQGISKSDDGWKIGAAVRWSDVLVAPLPAGFDMLKQAAQEVGGVQVQNAGTVVGNICNASPAADGMPPLLALDASVELMSPEGERLVALSDFVTGPRQTARRSNELVTGIWLPKEAAIGQSRFLKLGARKHLVISIAMVAARIVVSEGKITQAAISVGACSPVAQRLIALETALIGRAADQAMMGVTPDTLGELAPISDVRAAEGYRWDAAFELAQRAVGDVIGGSG